MFSNYSLNEWLNKNWICINSSYLLFLHGSKSQICEHFSLYWVSCSAVTVLMFLIILSLKMCFVSAILWDDGGCATITWIQCSLCHMGTESRGPTMCENLSPKASMTCDTSLWVSEAQQPQEIMTSVQSRISLIRKKTMAFWGTQMNKECYNILLILLLHINQSLMVKIMA